LARRAVALDGADAEARVYLSPRCFCTAATMKVLWPREADWPFEQCNKGSSSLSAAISRIDRRQKIGFGHSVR